jgi:hypothetical protein
MRSVSIATQQETVSNFCGVLVVGGLIHQIGILVHQPSMTCPGPHQITPKIKIGCRELIFPLQSKSHQWYEKSPSVPLPIALQSGLFDTN